MYDASGTPGQLFLENGVTRSTSSCESLSFDKLPISLRMYPLTCGGNVAQIRSLCAFIRELSWVNWKYLATLVSGARPWRAPRNVDTKHRVGGGREENLAAGMSASRRDAGAQTRKRRLGFYVESGSIRLPGQPSPRLTHPAPANHEVFCAYVSAMMILLIVGYKQYEKEYIHLYY